MIFKSRPPVSRCTGETPFLSRAMEEGCSCTAFPSKFYGLHYPEKLPECLKTDHRFLSGATDYTRESISGGPVVEGPPFGWLRKRVKLGLYPATTGKLSEIF
ncbi:hypothetical protein TNCV_2221011 [Trichonephila clavipes]|nr:hypothetical protein TNCV_2221011 [Trichonephila clavipes]